MLLFFFLLTCSDQNRKEFNASKSPEVFVIDDDRNQTQVITLVFAEFVNLVLITRT